MALAAALVAGCFLQAALCLERGSALPVGAPPAAAPTSAAAQRRPHVVRLRRETVPVRRGGKVVSFKTSYSGLVHVGRPAQEFRVVFDTGSGHVILPAVECESESCQAHRRYNMTASASASAINVNGSPVLPGELCDQVTIGFGTGEVTGEFVRERVCLGAADPSAGGREAAGAAAAPCAEGVHVVTAVEMSTQPFKSFGFDGIMGLGLDGLSLSRSFSFFGALSGGGALAAPQFAAFLTDGEGGEESEMTFGGHDAARAAEPLSWTPVALPELGHWAVEIVAVRVGGRTLEVCRDGTCRGVVDTGTSHLGIPAPHDQEVAALLTRTADDGAADCRLADAPAIEIEVPGRNLTLLPENYMRRMPLRGDVRIGSSTGVSLARTGGAAPRAQPHVSARAAAAALESERGLRSAAAAATRAEAAARWYCRPRLMPVDLPAPLGPKVFILGEPVLHRYYTVFDWGSGRLGFGLAAGRRSAGGAAAGEV